MTTSQEQEAQELTDKVLNIRFSYEKLNKLKLDLETEIKGLEDQADLLKINNEQYQVANKEFEKRLAEINVDIQAKQAELAQATSIYKEEIDKKFIEIEATKLQQEQMSKTIANKENQIMRDESKLIQQQKNIESMILQSEHQEKQNAVREVELNRRESSLNGINEVLVQKSDNLAQKEAHLNTFEKSLIERESTMIGKLNALMKMEDQLNQLKNAIENDRVNNENEKNRNGYVMKVLTEVQTRCITNVGQKITEDTIMSIRKNINDQYHAENFEANIVDKNILHDAEEVIAPTTPVVDETNPAEPVENNAEGASADVVVDETATIENEVAQTTTDAEKPADPEANTPKIVAPKKKK